MNDVITVHDKFYLLATSYLADDRTQVLKHGDTFAVFDRYGDVQTIGLGEQGLYHEGTRFLSRLELSIEDTRPMLLSSTVRKDNSLLAVDLTTPDISGGGDVKVAREELHLSRTKFLWHGACYERFRIQNYGSSPIDFSIRLRFEADFSDIFEVRGAERLRRGQQLEPIVEDGVVVLAYEGLDGVVRRSRFEFEPAPDGLSSSEARYVANLQPKAETTFYLTVLCEISESVPQKFSYDSALADSTASIEAKARDCRIETSNEQFNELLTRSMADLHMMISDTSEGPYPYAGVPWFNTVFGRDGIITALECLWVNPDIARGVLVYLASSQAKEHNVEQDAEPGKILHETRKGEMAALGEVPFGRYYGTVDATALFIMLAGAYYESTADRSTIEHIWPNVELALEWVDTHGDLDGDGFVEYARRSSDGLTQQGWKDSADSVFHADGTLAGPPIALCEVQGYVYAAKLRAAELASLLGHPKKAKQLTSEAQALQERFERAFWSEELSTYALALDGKKRPCKVRASNAGHALFSGIASQEHARRVADTLLSQESFSGWGVRTVANTEARYNPMSYHNGSVWPHDNALIGAGLARYGFKDSALKIMEGLFAASCHMELYRLPELFCGFDRRPGEAPMKYPVAASPQAWASASIFYLLQACLGLSVFAPQAVVRLSHPVLPDFLSQVRINNLRVGTASLDLHLERYENDVGINVVRRDGDVRVIVVK